MVQEKYPMKAADYTRRLLRDSVPVVRPEDEQTWDASKVMQQQDAELLQFWASNAPGSGAPECLMAGALQSLENKGMHLEDYGPLLAEGLRAVTDGDLELVLRTDMRLRAMMHEARADPFHPAQMLRRFASWEDLDAAVDWPPDAPVQAGILPDRVAAGWLGQLVGAAVGTALEGYTAAQIAKTFGPVTDYIRPPNTYNDDITFELAFLEAHVAKGANVTSVDIAENWVGQIPLGWSAEGVALAALRRGVLPPISGSENNPFDEWIGAQMRGLVCGTVVPGRAREAARLAWIDGCISHTSNGILGEVFNAVLAARAPLGLPLRDELLATIELIPADTGYGEVLRHARDACLASSDWRSAWDLCDTRYRDFNWIHAYPNAAAQIIGLWFGDDNFDDTLTILCGLGHDVDCNAAQMLGLLGLRQGRSAIDSRWTDPLLKGDIVTYMRRPRTLPFDSLVDMTLMAIDRHEQMKFTSL